jgi:SAM-dependent methyltransferase
MQREGFRVTAEYELDHWWFRSRRDLFLRQVDRAAHELGFPARPLRLLDFGCGTGFNLSFLRDYGAVCGADRLRPEDGEFRRQDGFPLLDVERDLAARKGSFHLVTALDVLEHLDDDVRGLRELDSLLAPGGQIVLTVPAYDWLWSGEDVISEHRRRYTRSRVVRACQAAGLQVRYASYFNLAILPAMAGVVWRLLAAVRRSLGSLDGGPGSTRCMRFLPEAGWSARAHRCRGSQHPLPRGSR